MKKHLILTVLSVLFAASAAHASIQTLVDETFRTTFSHFGALDQMLTCYPGIRGGFSTNDVLVLQGHTIETGLSFGNQNFRAESELGRAKDPTPNGSTAPSPRPYSEGCKLAIAQFKAAIAGKKVVEVDVQRVVESYPNTVGRAHRDIEGSVDHVTYVTAPLNYESLRLTLGGFEFKMDQILNGPVKSAP